MTSFNMIIKNRFWQQCQRFDRVENMKHEITETDRTPQVGGSAS